MIPRIVLNDEAMDERATRLMVRVPVGKAGFGIAKPQPTHTGVSCHDCGKNPIVGPRFKCGCVSMDRLI